MTTRFGQFLRDENAATAVEYGIFAAITGLGLIAGVGGIGEFVQTIFRYVITGFTTF